MNRLSTHVPGVGAELLQRAAELRFPHQPVFFSSFCPRLTADRRLVCHAKYPRAGGMEKTYRLL